MCELIEIIKQANQVSTDKGFWEDYDKMIKKMKGLPKQFNNSDIERMKIAFYNEKISLIASELGEATEAMRNGKFFDGNKEGLETMFSLMKNDTFKFQTAYMTHIKDTFENELADSFIRLCDLCYKMNIDIESFVKLKMEYNKTRGVKHGKKF